MREWVKHVRVHDAMDGSHYVCYHVNDVRLRLTNRGTWDADAMDIYWPTRGAAYGALAVAPAPTLCDEALRAVVIEAIQAHYAADSMGVQDALLRAEKMIGGGE